MDNLKTKQVNTVCSLSNTLFTIENASPLNYYLTKPSLPASTGLVPGIRHYITLGGRRRTSSRGGGGDQEVELEGEGLGLGGGVGAGCHVEQVPGV